MQSPTSTNILEEPQGAEPPFRRYNTRVGPHLPSPVHPRPLRRAPPSKRARGSLRVLGLSLHSLQLPRVLNGHRLSYPLLRGLGVNYFTVTQYPGMWIVVPRTFTESSIMIYQHWQWTHGSEILCGWSRDIRCYRL